MKPALFFSILIIGVIIYDIFYISSLQSKNFTLGDFRAQYTGSILAKRNQYAKLYDLKAQFSVQKELFPKLIYEQLLPFFSPPLLAFAISPLAFFSFKDAYIIFCLFLTTILLFTSLLFYLKTFMSEKAWKLFNIENIDILLILISFFPFWINILNAQLSLLWILIAFSGYLHLEQKKYLLAGLTLSLLSLKIHLLFIPLVFFIAIRNWRVIGGLCLGVCILFFLQVILFGAETMRNYFNLLFSLNFNLDSYGLNLSQQVSLKGALYRLFQSKFDAAVFFNIWLTAVILILVVCFKYWMNIGRRLRGPELKLQLSMVVIIMLLTSPHTHYHDLSLLTIPIFLILQYLLNDYLPRKKNLKKRSFYPLVKYGLILILIVFSAAVSYFPPLILIPYTLLLYLIIKLQKINI